jgi:outer membrane protein insertion porin family
MTFRHRSGRPRLQSRVTSFGIRGGVAALALALIAAGPAWAFEPFTIRDIRIEGAQRIDPGTVFGYLPARVGDRIDTDAASAAIKALFATGLFRDVSLSADGDVLVVRLAERPAIGDVEITGNKEFDRDTLRRSLRDMGLAESRIFDRALLERAEQELKRLYLSRGKYAVKVTSTITPLERNRVGIVLAVEEGESARIGSIRFVGNQAFGETDLRKEISLGTPNWLSWYTKADRYSRSKLDADLEALRSFYLDRGYLEFNIRSTEVSIGPDKESIDIVISVEEGRQFKVREIAFGGELLGREGEFRKLLAQAPGDVYSGRLMSETVNRITDRLGSLGFAFAAVNAAPNLDRDRNEVSFTIVVQPGRRAYVRRIDIAGNSRTRDEVVRRELRQFEDAWYDADKIRLSRERIGRLGYFTDVQIQTQPIADAPDQVDLRVVVTEKPTGAIALGVGVSSAEKLIVTGSIEQQNFLGTGKALSVSVNSSRLFRTAAVSYVDPYFTEDGISRSIDAFTRRNDARILNLGDYILRSQGVGLRFGLPYTELDRISVGLSAETNRIELGALAPTRYRELVDEYGERINAVLGTVGWARDSRDSALTPNRGRLQRASFEVTVPAAELRYWRGTYVQQYYLPLTRDYTLAFNGDLGYGGQIGDRMYPVFKNFYAGGIGSVRGFYTSSLGPQQIDQLPQGGTRQVPLGGQIRIAGSAEFIFPFPGTGSDRSIRSFLFTDVGNVFAENAVELSELRASAGIGVNWFTPIGPMKLSLGQPLRSRSGDRTQAFQFQFGTAF